MADGAVVLAVCAGFQVVGRSFPVPRANPTKGSACSTSRRSKAPAAGPSARCWPSRPGLGALPVLTGFENHGGLTLLVPGTDTVALATVTAGVGNGGGDGSEGAVRGHVVGTYLHGPVLARNPALADLLLSWALGGTALCRARRRRGRGPAGGAAGRAGRALATAPTLGGVGSGVSPGGRDLEREEVVRHHHGAVEVGPGQGHPLLLGPGCGAGTGWVSTSVPTAWRAAVRAASSTLEW